MVDKVLESKEEVESVEQSLRSSNSPTGTAREPTTEQQKVSLERRRREEKMERGELQDEMPAHSQAQPSSHRLCKSTSHLPSLLLSLGCELAALFLGHEDDLGGGEVGVMSLDERGRRRLGE